MSIHKLAATEKDLRSAVEQEEWGQQLAELSPVRKVIEVVANPARLVRLSIKRVWQGTDGENSPRAA